jgi:hypothetical protein
MASGASSEVVHCPNCKEDVPKTLYCLNCGFPLYKEEQLKEEVKNEPKSEPEPAKPVEPAVEEDAVIIVDEDKEEATKQEEPKEEATPEVLEDKERPKEAEIPEALHVTEEAPVVEEKPASQVESVIESEVKVPDVAPESPEKKRFESEPVAVVEETEPAEVITPIVEATPAPMEIPQPVEMPSEPLSSGIEASKNEAIELVEEFQAPKTFVPDPLTKDLMENLAKNISLKLKLVKLYRDGAVKEEMFTKLFEKYAFEGKIWSSHREEILKKLTAEIEEMEDAYEAASEALEFLEVRRSIGEASEGEYMTKAPAYKWDIDIFDNEMGEKRNKTAYLENISNALTNDELKELRELASIQYNTLESLQLSKDEFLASIKDNLYESIKILG